MKRKTFYYICFLNLFLINTLSSYTQSLQVGIISHAENNRFCEGIPEWFPLEANPSGGSGPYNYTWTFSWNNDTLTDKSISVRPTTSGEVKLTVSDNSLPAKTKTATYQIKEIILDADFSFNPDSICAQNPIQFISTVSGGNPDYGFFWNFGDGNNSSEKNPVHDYIASGCSGISSFDVYMSAYDADGCYTSVEKTVHVKNKPYLDFIDTENLFSPFKHCHPVGSDPTFDVVLENNSQNTSCITSYHISWGDGNVDEGAIFPIRHTYTTVGAFELVINAANSSGCDLVWSRFVYNQSSPAAGMESYGGTEGCAPIEFSFGLVGYENNSIGTTYSWDFGDGSPIIVWDSDDPFVTDTITHIYQNSSCIYGGYGGDYTTIVTVNNGCGEIEATVTGVRVWLKPDASVDDGDLTLDSICTNETIQLINNSTNGYYGTECSSYSEYMWDFGNGNTADVELMPPMSWSEPGEYNIVLDVGNPCGVSRDTFNIIVMEPPVADATVNNTSGCAPLIPVIENNSTGEGIEYFWQITPSSGFTFLNGTSNTSSEPEISFNEGGLYRAVLYVINVCDETDSVVFNFNVFSRPGGRIENLSNICITDPVIHPSVVYNDYGRPVTSFNWTFTGGSPSVASTEDPGEHIYSSAGEYMVFLSLENECGSRNLTDTFYVHNAPEVDVNTPISICESNSLVIDGTTISNVTSFIWQTQGDGYFDNDSLLNPVYHPGNGDLINSGTELRIIAEAGFPCKSDTAFVDLNIQKEPKVQVDEDVVICEENAYSITSATAVNYDVLHWSTSGDGYFSDSTILLPTYYPGSGDLSTGHVELTLTANAISPCLLDASSTFAITYASIPTINAGPDLDVSMDEPIPLSASGTDFISVLWNSETGMGSFSDPTGLSPVFTIDPGFSGSIIELTIEATGGFGCDPTYDTIVLTVYPSPVAYAGLDATICEGSDVSISTASAEEFSEIFWTTMGSGTFDNETILSPNYHPSNEDIENREVVLVLHARAIEPIEHIVANDSMTINIAHNALTDLIPFDAICEGQTYQINDVEYQDVNTISWSSSGDGFFDGNGETNPVFTFSANDLEEDTLYFYVQVSSIGPCVNVDYDTLLLRSFHKPDPSFEYDNPDGCAPLSVNFTNTSSGDELAYYWDLGNGLESYEEDPGEIVYQQGRIADTTYTVTLEVSNLCDTLSTSREIIVKPIPVTDFGMDVDWGCSIKEIHFFNVTRGLPDTYIWKWGDGSDYSLAEQPGFHAFETGEYDTVYTITLIAENECGVDSIQKQVQIFPSTVNAFFETDTTFGCAPFEVSFTNYSRGVLGDEPFLNWSWNFGDGNISDELDPTHVFFDPGLYTVTLYVNDTCSLDFYTTEIDVMGAPDADFVTDKVLYCEHDSVFVIPVNMPIDEIASVTWDFGDSTLGNDFNDVHVYDSPGEFTIILTAKDIINGCTSNISRNITINQAPVAAFSIPENDECPPLHITFINETEGGDYYSWDYGNGNISIDSNGQQVYSEEGDYTIILNATDTKGCNDTVSHALHVNPKPSAGFEASSLLTCFPPVDIEFNNLSAGADDYVWNFGNGNTSKDTHPVTTFSDYGDYNINLVATNIYLCTDTSRMVYHVYHNPVADFTVDSTIGCDPYLVPFINLSEYGEEYYWNFIGQGSSEEEKPFFTLEGEGVYSVSLKVIGSGGCADSITKLDLITVNPSPVADFEYSRINEIDTIQFHNYSLGAIAYLWDFGDGQSSDESDPLHRYLNYGLYNVGLTAINEYSCTNTMYDSISFELFKGLFFPNAFAPDNVSEEVREFKPVGIGLVKYHLVVYDTWGNLIWETTELENSKPAEGWDGTLKGETLLPDVYVWHLREAIFKDGSSYEGQRYGTVTLIK